MRVVSPGGVAVDPGASPRVGEGGALRPAFRLQGSAGVGGAMANMSSWLDPASPVFWRVFWVLAAFGYLSAWHLRLPVVGRIRV